MSVYDKIKNCCEQKGFKISRLPEMMPELGLYKSTISCWKSRGSRPNPKTLLAIANYFDKPIEYFYAEDSNISAIYENTFTVPLFASVSAGLGTYANDDIIDYMPIMAHSRAEAEETFCVRVSGDSMYPKIEDNDIVQIHKQSSVDSGDIAVVRVDGEEGCVKRVVYGSEFIILESINPTFPPRKFIGSDVLRIEVVGKVTRVIKEL